MRTIPARAIDRREALRGLGLLAGGGLLAACAGRADPPATGIDASPAWTAHPWEPVDVGPDRVIRTVVGLRPYRAAGFVVRTEMLDDKPIVHNYGHGGGGITLSWGTAHLAMEEAARAEHRSCAVIGCGAVGLATARLLQRHGWDVRIYAKELPPRTTSNIAGGQWSPYSVFQPDRVATDFMPRFARASRLAYRYYQDFVGPHHGVRWIDNYYVGNGPAQQPSWLADLQDVFPNMEKLSAHEHPFPRPYVQRVTTMMVEPHIYLAEMVRDFRLAGGEIEVRAFADRAQLAALPEPIVVNCTGLGSYDLFGDDELVPIKGQLSILLPQPEVDYILLLDGGYYMFPRSDGILLGGTFERGVWDLDPNPSARDRILGAHESFFDAMSAKMESA